MAGPAPPGADDRPGAAARRGAPLAVRTGAGRWRGVRWRRAVASLVLTLVADLGLPANQVAGLVAREMTIGAFRWRWRAAGPRVRRAARAPGGRSRAAGSVSAAIGVFLYGVALVLAPQTNSELMTPSQRLADTLARILGLPPSKASRSAAPVTATVPEAPAGGADRGRAPRRPDVELPARRSVGRLGGVGRQRLAEPGRAAVHAGADDLLQLRGRLRAAGLRRPDDARGPPVRGKPGPPRESRSKLRQGPGHPQPDLRSRADPVPAQAGRARG